MEEAIGKI